MLTNFNTEIKTKLKIQDDSTILIAVSGGLDSMVLLHLLKKSNFNIAVAHCNFKLRGEESDLDTEFVVNYCSENQIKLHTINFDTTQFSEDNKISIQIAARKLRYEWFFRLKQEFNYTYIATAHHLDDSLETFLINLSRGSGIEGLLGIQNTENIIRPLLSFSRDEILNYAKQENISWREDSSNASDKYIRNKIRHQIIPILKEINPSLLHSFETTTNNLQSVYNYSQEITDKILSEIISCNDTENKLSISKLIKYKNYDFILYSWLKPYGFKAWSDINELVYAQSGKYIESQTYQLLKNRDELILVNKKNTPKVFTKFIEHIEDIKSPIKLSLKEVSNSEPLIQNKNIIYVDKNLLKFPLKLCKREQGDYFCPVGLNGRSKKVSKFLKDEKLSLIAKDSVWILKSNDQIVWIIGMRQDQRFTINNQTTSIIKIEIYD